MVDRLIYKMSLRKYKLDNEQRRALSYVEALESHKKKENWWNIFVRNSVNVTTKALKWYSEYKLYTVIENIC